MLYAGRKQEGSRCACGWELGEKVVQIASDLIHWDIGEVERECWGSFRQLGQTGLLSEAQHGQEWKLYPQKQ